jgi:hypothetical protein
VNIEVRHKFVGRVFLVPKTIGIIPEGCRLYCFGENEEYLHCFSSVDVCGVRHVNLHKDQIKNLILMN